MSLRKIDIKDNKILDLEMVLTKTSGDKIITLTSSTIKSLNIDIDKVWEISVSVPHYIVDEISMKTKKNPEYDLVKERQIIQINNKDRFLITKINEGEKNKGEVQSKEIVAFSLDIQLSNLNIAVTEKVRQLYSDSTNTSEGALNYLENYCSWKLGYLDNEAKVEHINGGTNNKYRLIKATEGKIRTYLTDVIGNAFNCLFIFNSENKTYDVYSREKYGKKRDIILCKDNVVEGITKNIDADKIVTRLHARGKDNLVFNNINPLGTDYIEDISLYRNSTYMSSDLLKALDRYDKLTEDLHNQFLQQRKNLSDIQNKKNKSDEDLQTLESKCKTLLQEQSALIKTLSNYPKGNQNISDNISNIKVQLDLANNNREKEKQNNINLENQIKSIKENIANISKKYNKRYSEDSKGKLFNEALLSEYENFIIEDSYKNEACLKPETLMEEAKKQLKDLNKPSITFNVTVEDFLANVPFLEDKMNISLELGDFIQLYSEKLGIKEFVRFVGYTYSPSSNSLSLTFSNKDKVEDSLGQLGATLHNLSNTAYQVELNKPQWNLSKDSADWIETFRTNSLDLVSQQIKSKTKKNTVDISENGIFLGDMAKPEEQLAMTNNVIAMTRDNWKTVDVAITPYWINGKLICAESIATESLDVALKKEISKGQEAKDSIKTVTQEFKVSEGKLKSAINEKIGSKEMWNILQQDAEKFSSLVGGTQAYKNVSTQISSQITQTKKEITNTITATSNNLQQNITGVDKSLKIAKDDINNRFVQMKANLDGFKFNVSNGFGGENIIKNSGFYGLDNYFRTEYQWTGHGQNVTWWKDNSEWVLNGTNALVINGFNAPTGVFGVRQEGFKLKPNTVYTLSGFASAHRGKWRINISANDWTWLTSATGNKTGGKDPNNWDRFVLTFTTPNNSNNLTYCHLDLMLSEAGDNAFAFFTNLVLNEGAYAVPWQPNNYEFYGNVVTIDMDKLRCQFEDGSYAQMGRHGFELMIDGMTYPYHALMTQGVVNNLDFNISNRLHRVVLPKEFKNKDFRIQTQVQGWNFDPSRDVPTTFCTGHQDVDKSVPCFNLFLACSSSLQKENVNVSYTVIV